MVVFSLGEIQYHSLSRIDVNYMMSDQRIGTEEERLRQRTTRRVTTALALIALTIIALTLLDRYWSAPKSTAVPTSPPVEPPLIATLPKPIQPAPEPVQSGTLPTGQTTPRLPPPPPPSVSNDPLAPVERNAPAKLIQGSADSAGEVVPESTGGAGRTPAQAMASAPNPGYVVQLGVFSSVEHAQSWQSKLKEQGIPTTLETRVIVGPFQDRAEAEVARKKLKMLGVSGLVAQRK